MSVRKTEGNPYIIRNGICTVFVRNRLNKVVAKFIVDEDDADRVLKRRWLVGRDGKYFITSLGKNKQIAIQNFILGSQMVDHINNNTFDNRRANLRVVTRQQNAQNVSKTKRKTSSKYLGVSWDKNLNKWSAFIQIPNMKIKRIGNYTDETYAAYQRDQWALQLYGEYANTNLNLDDANTVVVPRQDGIKPSSGALEGSSDMESHEAAGEDRRNSES